MDVGERAEQAGNGVGPRRLSGRVQRPRLVLVLISVGVLLVGFIGGGWALREFPKTCSGSPLLISIAAQPDIAPAIMEVASRFNVQPHEVRGRCVRVAVYEKEPAKVARFLAGGPFAGGEELNVDGWVPESSMWVNVARDSVAGARNVSTEVSSIASSPVVLATSRAVATEFRRDDIEPSWRMLFPKFATLFGGPRAKTPVSVQMLDPSLSGAGVATMIAIRRIIGTGRQSGPLLTSFVRGMQRSTWSDNTTMFTYLTGLARYSRPIVVSTEQAVFVYNDTHRPNPATPLLPKEGSVLMDYPFAVTTTDQARREAVEAFRWALRSRLSLETIQRFGFRTPQGLIDREIAQRYEVNGYTPRLVAAAPKPGQVDEALQAWNRLGLGTNILVLTDVSRSVGQEIPGAGETRLRLGIRAALLGLQLFPNDTNIGLWQYAERLDGDKPYKQLVPIGPITQRLGGHSRRAELRRIAQQTRPTDQPAEMNDTILAAYRELKRTWRPDKFNAMLVMASTNDNTPGGMSTGALLDAIREEADLQRPVQIIFVAFGTDIDTAAMERIAQATGGGVYSTRDPNQIINVFMDSIARRLCTPDCPET
ncbi:MAG TPA: substrate-binding domain-containing protein [Streptosporangiaceae bacterium]|nr:substrate-binding domain-containing protein [Streptosporangiaceae bacterium]